MSRSTPLQDRINEVAPTLSAIADNVKKLQTATPAELAKLGFTSLPHALIEIERQINDCASILEEGW